MHDVFVSYCRDDRAWVEGLVEILRDLDVPYWLDRDQIPLSAKWRVEAVQGIEEASLFLVCDSEFLRASDPCAFEAEGATERDLPWHTVTVGTDLRSAAEATAQAWRSAFRAREARVDLLVRSRDWEAQGRPKRALVGAIPLRRLRKGLVKGAYEQETARAYLRASSRRARRRAAVLTAAVLAVYAGYIIGKVVPKAQQIVNGYNTTQGQEISSTNSALDATSVDPYLGLQAAASRGADESALNADVIQAALASPVPDDAFTVPDNGLSFLQRPATGTIDVRGGDGVAWSRSASAADERTAHKLGTVPLPAPVSQSATWQAGSSSVTLARDGKLWRQVTVSGPVAAAATSPDGRWLAVATGSQVDLVDIDRGAVRTTLRGAPAPVTDLDWTTAGDRLWAVAGHTVVSWRTRAGTLLLNEPGRWYQATFPGSEPGTVWVASRDGDLRLIRLGTDTVSRTIHVGSVKTATVDAKSDMAAVTGLKGELWFVDLATGRSRQVQVPNGCLPMRPAFSTDSKLLYEPCDRGQVLGIDVASGAQDTSIPVTDGADAVAVNPNSGDVIIGTFSGEVLSWHGGTASTLKTIPCRPDTSAIAVSPDGTGILPVGLETGQIACGSVQHTVSGHVRWDELDDLPGDSVLSLAAAFDPTGGEFVVGFSDGTLYLHPSENFQPIQEVTEVTGGIRDMFAAPGLGTDGGSGLFVATRTGELERYPLCPQCLTNKAMADQAGRMLRRAVDLGLAPAALLQPVAAPSAPASASASASHT